MKIVAIIQARMGATRLPGKVVLKLPPQSSVTVLDHIIRRLKRSRIINQIIVATSRKQSEQPIVNIAHSYHLPVYRGSETDVLSRYYRAAQKFSADIIVRICADSPCLDVRLLNSVIKSHLKFQPDYTHTVGYPLGTNIEIIAFPVLKRAYFQAKQDLEREHVTPFIYLHPKQFKISTLQAPKSYHDPKLRLTLDTPADYTLLSAIFKALYSQSHYFGLDDIINLLKRQPWLRNINAHVRQQKLGKFGANIRK